MDVIVIQSTDGRRIFNIDVGDMSPIETIEYLEKVKQDFNKAIITDSILRKE